MKKVLIRCDSSLSIGSGHLYRCRTLARYLKRKDYHVIFMCRNHPGNFNRLILEEFDVIILPPLLGNSLNWMHGCPPHASWLGATQEQDAADCLSALAKHGISSVSWVIVDHYSINEVWESIFVARVNLSFRPGLIVIDDLADRIHIADIIVDQNFYGDITLRRYNSIVPSNCKQLLGPRFTMLNPEYAYLHQCIPVRRNLKRIMVFFGGVDTGNRTGDILNKLVDMNLKDLEIDVVVGVDSSHLDSIKQIAHKVQYVCIYQELPSLAGLITRADLAIGAAGSTTWERICLGLPTVAHSVALNQIDTMQQLERHGYLWSAESFPMSSLQRSLDLSVMSKRCLDLVDGRGVSRVVNEIEQYQL